MHLATKDNGTPDVLAGVLATNERVPPPPPPWDRGAFGRILDWTVMMPGAVIRAHSKHALVGECVRWPLRVREWSSNADEISRVPCRIHPKSETVFYPGLPIPIPAMSWRKHQIDGRIWFAFIRCVVKKVAAEAPLTVVSQAS